MAPRGRPPKPTELKRKTGNPGKRALPKATVALPATIGTPRAPVGLAAHGKAVWATVWEAARPWLSPKLDAIRVETACRLADEAAQLRALTKKHGMLLEEPIATPSGVVVGQRLVPNPAAKMLRDVEKQLDRELSALGFDPTARARLGLAEVKKQSIIEGLFGQPAGPAKGRKVIDTQAVEILPDR